MIINGTPGFLCSGTYRSMEDALERLRNLIQIFGEIQEKRPACAVADANRRFHDLTCRGMPIFRQSHGGTVQARPPLQLAGVFRYLFRYHEAPMNRAAKSSRGIHRRALRDILLYGLCGGVLITILKLTEYRFLVVEHSVEIYGGLVAALFSGLGIWLGLTLTRKKTQAKAFTGQPAAPGNGQFTVDEKRLNELGITPRELEILGLIAVGLSTREIAERLCVSENTVKTHSSRLFDKLGARRRTQAVQLGKEAGLIP